MEHMNLPACGQIGLDPPKVGFIMFFAIAEPSIDRNLAHFEALIKQKLAKFGCSPRARSNQISRVPGRSEEHTSEIQSLMPLPSAVFVLKKKKTKITKTQPAL